MSTADKKNGTRSSGAPLEWGGTKSFIGASPAFTAARERIRVIAETDATALIEGETGTGKELAARIIHYQSARRGGPFIPVNCGALPDTILESELFGYRRGAFTDAKDHAPGILSLADGGTLFLDEVDSLSMRAQVVLLRFLQERTIRPLGGSSERRIDTRVICACNRSLERLVAEQVFRHDLYYRLNVMYVELPPLRSRVEDIALFAAHFLAELGRRYGTEVSLDADSHEWLCAQRWPGNIRQLENLLEREYLHARGARVLRLSALKLNVAPSVTPPRPTQSEAPTEPNLDGPEAWHYQEAKARVVERFDRDYLQKLLHFTQGNVAHAARVAHKERRDLGRLLQKYGISAQNFRSE